MISKYLSGRRRTILSVVIVSTIAAFAVFFVKRIPAHGEPRVVSVDSVAAHDSIARADSLAQAKIAQDTVRSDSIKHRHGENPDFAAKMGWPVKGPTPLPGALLPEKRIVAYY